MVCLSLHPKQAADFQNLRVSIEVTTPQHKSEISKWWNHYGFPTPLERRLSSNGLTVLVDGVPSAAAWLYQTDSSLCHIDYAVARPGLSKRELRVSYIALLQAMKVLAGKLGFSDLRVFAKRKSLISALKRCGFSLQDKGHAQLSCEV